MKNVVVHLKNLVLYKIFCCKSFIISFILIVGMIHVNLLKRVQKLFIIFIFVTFVETLSSYRRFMKYRMYPNISPDLRIIGGTFQFESKAHKQLRMRHKNGGTLWLDYISENPRNSRTPWYINRARKQNKRDSIFDIVPGLIGEGISLRSVNYPTRYIRQQYTPRGTLCSISPHPYGRRYYYKVNRFQREATWIPELGLYRNGIWGISFRSFTNQSCYMKSTVTNENKQRIRVEPINNSMFSKMEATWIPIFA